MASIKLQDQAQDNLSFIRNAMARAERVSYLSGVGGVLIGCVALITMLIAGTAVTLQAQLLTWIGAAVIAVLIGAFTTWIKAKRDDLVLIGEPGRRFLLCLVPVVGCTAVLTFALWSTEQAVLVPAVWMMFYGCAMLAAGTYAASPVMIMGACFIFAGLLTLALPASMNNALLGATFGGLHLLFGYQVYKHHGG